MNRRKIYESSLKEGSNMMKNIFEKTHLHLKDVEKIFFIKLM